MLNTCVEYPYMILCFAIGHVHVNNDDHGFHFIPMHFSKGQVHFSCNNPDSKPQQWTIDEALANVNLTDLAIREGVNVSLDTFWHYKHNKNIYFSHSIDDMYIEGHK